MGLFSGIASTVLTSYKADTSEHKRALQSLRGEERKLAKARLDELDASNKAIDGHIAAIGKVAAAVGAVIGAYVTLKKAAKDYLDDSQLRFAAQRYDIEQLRAATHGLMTETQLLSLAAGVANSDYRLTQVELNDVATAMLALRKQGNDFNQVIQNTTKAVVENNMEGLKPFGVHLEELGNKVANHTQLIERLRSEAKNLGADYAIAGDDMLKASVAFEDSTHRLSVALGRLAQHLAPVIEKMADFLDYLPKFGENMISGGNDNLGRLEELQREREYRVRQNMPQKYVNEIDQDIAKELNAIGYRFFGKGRQGYDRYEQFKKIVASGDYRKAIDVLNAAGRDRARAQEPDAIDMPKDYLQGATRPKGSGAGSNPIVVMIDDPRYSETIKNALGVEFAGTLPQGRTFKNDLSLKDIGPKIAGDFGDPAAAARVAENARALADLAKATQRKETILQSLFGNVEDIDAYATAMGAFKSVATEAFSAWLNGTKSVSAAIKDAIAGQLRALAMEMFSRSLFHTAAGVGALATGGPIAGAAAGAHFKAAGLYAGGAVAIGAVARQLGPSGGGASAGAGARGAVSPSGGASTTNQTFILGDSFIEESPRRRAAKIRGAMERADQYRGNRREILDFK